MQCIINQNNNTIKNLGRGLYTGTLDCTKKLWFFDLTFTFNLLKRRRKIQKRLPNLINYLSLKGQRHEIVYQLSSLVFSVDLNNVAAYPFYTCRVVHQKSIIHQIG
jgi:hypothetical protein